MYLCSVDTRKLTKTKMMRPHAFIDNTEAAIKSSRRISFIAPARVGSVILPL